jgi:hypothetical protein
VRPICQLKDLKQWYINHYCGDTIDKIGKGTEALFEYFGRTFEIVQGGTTPIIALIVLWIL